MLGIAIPPLTPTVTGESLGWVAAVVATALVAICAWVTWRVSQVPKHAVTYHIRPEERKAA